MSKFAVGRMVRDQPRFFDGRYVDGTSTWSFPITTGAPDKAREYPDRDVAKVVADLFNAIETVRSGRISQDWIPVELPESWT